MDMDIYNKTCHFQILNNYEKKCFCRIHIKRDIIENENYYIYYMLENFYQNQRRYVKSIDNYQLLGLKGKNNSELSENCEPFRYTIQNNVKLKNIPCGAIANSFFNGMS